MVQKTSGLTEEILVVGKNKLLFVENFFFTFVLFPQLILKEGDVLGKMPKEDRIFHERFPSENVDNLVNGGFFIDVVYNWIVRNISAIFRDLDDNEIKSQTKSNSFSNRIKVDQRGISIKVLFSGVELSKKILP